MKVALKLAGIAAGIGLALWGVLLASDKVLFHGFATICADGHPEFDPQVCGISWIPGLPYVLAGIAGLVLLAVSAWDRLFTRLLFGAVGVLGLLLALFLLWSTTWVPVNPRFPEPAWPQVVLLFLSAGVLVGALVLGNRRQVAKR